MGAEGVSTQPDKQAEQAQPPEAGAGGAGPRGIGTAVAIDWGLTVQFLTTAALVATGHMAGSRALSAPGVHIAAVLGALVGAAAFFIQGEALRRGRRLAWMLQVGFSVLLLLGLPFVLIGAIGDLAHGRAPAVASTIVLVIVNPIATWLLTRPSTRAWAGSTSVEAALARHGGLWPVWIGLLALVGGVAVAFGI